jgi:NAD(P)-dependent dehydrogenase (short-subunit alcohol dehydrogenase family)
MKKVLATGATGQIGSELTTALRENLGAKNVIAAGHEKKPEKTFLEARPFHFIDVNRLEDIATLVEKYKANTL